MPNTRSGRKTTDSRTHLPNTVPQQVFFPHRRKTVRRTVQDVPDKRQMTFLPEMMRRRNTVQDSEEEDTEYEEPVRLMLKRKRKPKVGIENEHDDGDQCLTPSDTEQIVDTKRRKRRQSTMTQIVDGRRPAPDDADPEFRPVKKRRTSRGKKASDEADERKKRQQTLTQMVPGLGSFGVISDEDVEDDMGVPELESRQGQEYNDAFARGFVSEGLLHLEGDNRACPHAPGQDQAAEHLSEGRGSRSPAGGLKTRGSIRNAGQGSMSPVIAGHVTSTARPSTKSNFGLLSTPEKRKVHEIPSSQSPSGSPISTQVTPQRPARSPLKPRSGNFLNVIETSSKRRKQVTFQELDKEQVPPPPILRKFASVIQDSEDEDDVVSDDGAEQNERNNTLGDELLRSGNNEPIRGTDIGEETQAILVSIDRACAQPLDDTARLTRDLLADFDEPMAYGMKMESQELGDSCRTELSKANLSNDSLCTSAHTSIKQESTEVAQSVESTLPSSPPLVQIPHTRSLDFFGTGPVNMTPAQHVDDAPSSARPPEQSQQRESLPSTPMSLGDDSSDEETEELVSSSQQPTSVHHSHTPTEPPPIPTRVDECPVQVPRSPSTHPETQQSYSSKAERQIQSEYQTYSQYRLNPPTSSMHVAGDPGFSYQATPFPPRQSTQQVQHSGHLSQATTIDPTQSSPRATPRKAKSQPNRSTTTTPQKIPSSMPFVSPLRPPPLLVPSSYPSPGKVMAGWSSPVMDQSSPIASRTGVDKGESQWAGNASWEDFSIPAPPPILEISDDEEDL